MVILRFTFYLLCTRLDIDARIAVHIDIDTGSYSKDSSL